VIVRVFRVNPCRHEKKKLGAFNRDLIRVRSVPHVRGADQNSVRDLQTSEVAPITMLDIEGNPATP
jgi:hypothetical protein